MAVKFTEEQLNTFDKSLLVQLLVAQQEQNEKLTQELHDLNEKMQLLMEQLVLSNKKRFGTSSEKMGIENQICFYEKDGNIVFFNESEAVFDPEAEEPESLEIKPEKRKIPPPGGKGFPQRSKMGRKGSEIKKDPDFA